MVKIEEVMLKGGLYPASVLVDKRVMVRFNHYMRPHGRQSYEYIPASVEHVEKVKQVLATGYVFECELLSNGVFSMTITHADAGDLAMELFALPTNDPAEMSALLQKHMDKMLSAFDFNAAAAMVTHVMGNDADEDEGDNDGEEAL